MSMNCFPEGGQNVPNTDISFFARTTVWTHPNQREPRFRMPSLWPAHTSDQAQQGIAGLIEACSRGEHERVQFYLAAGTSPDLRDPLTGVYPLLTAVTEDYPMVVKMLLSSRANPNIKCNGMRETALMRACRYGRHESIALLLQYRSDLDARNRAGSTAKDIAAHNGHLEVVEDLFERHCQMVGRDTDMPPHPDEWAP
jgi:ankyrin repeat protein